MLSPHLVDACRARRAQLLSDLGQRSAAIYAGTPRGRNYAANPYPFRASSHFLYLVGLGLEGALLWLDRGRALLLLPDLDPNDALWHGEVKAPSELSRALGIDVGFLSQHAAELKSRTPATLAPVTADDRNQVAGWLGRSVDAPSREDELLADSIVSLRLVHDEGARLELRRAARVSVEAHLAGMRATRLGDYERDVRAAMENVITRAGMTTAYGSIVTVHGEVLHNHVHHHPLLASDLLLADVGAETDTGYAADITRTWPVSGRFSATQRDIYGLVLNAQKAAIERVKPGTRYRDVHLAASRAICEGLVDLGILEGSVDALVEDGAHALFFPHGIGHLLGLDVHDMEDLGDRAGYAKGRTRSPQFGLAYLRLDRDLVPGMLVTIEPGFYQVKSLLDDPSRVGLPAKALNRGVLSKFADVRGIRIEDDVLVTEDGSDVLTAALPKSIEQIEALVGPSD